MYKADLENVTCGCSEALKKEMVFLNFYAFGIHKEVMIRLRSPKTFLDFLQKNAVLPKLIQNLKQNLKLICCFERNRKKY